MTRGREWLVASAVLCAAAGCGAGDADDSLAADGGARPDAGDGADGGGDSEAGSDAGIDAGHDVDAGPPCAPEDDDPPAVIIGSGEGAWGDLGCEETVALATIGQGCWHFTAGVKEKGLALDNSTITYWEVEWEDGTIVYSDYLVGPRWRDAGDGWHVKLLQYAIVTCDEFADIEGELMTVRVRVTSAGVEATDSHRIQVFRPGF